jgi:predicted ester cyclase
LNRAESTDNGVAPDVPMNDTLIHEFYEHFNDRRVAAAAALIADDAVLELTPGHRVVGGCGYTRFAESWIAAFPNARFCVDRIEHRGGALSEVYLLATGTHRGVLDFAPYRFQPSGVDAVLHIRDLLEIHAGKITASALTIDLNDLIRQFSIVDFEELAKRLEAIRVLASELALETRDPLRRRDVANRLGPELDAARRALRPHFYR